MNITACISAARFHSFLIASEGLFKIKQKWLTGRKLIAFKGSSNLAFLTQSEDSVSRRLRSESSKGRKKGRGEKNERK